MYQLVLRAKLPEYAMRQVRADRATRPDVTYFLGNSTKDLMTLPDIKIGSRTAFIGDVYRGFPVKKEYTEWPWNKIPEGQDVAKIIQNVPVTIEQVVYYRHFDFSQNYPTMLTYILFGYGDEAHMTNYQTKAPDFDHIVSLENTPDWLQPQMLEAGVQINFSRFPIRIGSDDNPTTSIKCTNPFKSLGEYQVQFQGNNEDHHQISVGKTHSFMTKILNVNDPCPGITEPGK